MPIRRLLFGYDIVMGVGSSIAAFIVSYQAYKAHLTTGKKSFLILQSGFIFVGIGLLGDSLLSWAGILSRLPPLLGIGYLTYFISTLIGYGLILGSHIVDRLERPGEILSVLPLIGYRIFSEFILLILIAAIIIQSAINLLLSRSLNKALVFSAFFLIFLSHLSFMLESFARLGLLIAGHVLRFVGFMVLIVFILKTVKIS